MEQALPGSLAVNLIGRFLDSGGMRAPGSEDAVVIEKAGEAHVITVNCPDRSGLGCDVCRIILDFGLYITKGGQILPERIHFFFCELLRYLDFERSI